MATKRSIGSGLQVGFGLISTTAVLAVVGLATAIATDNVVLRVVIVAVVAALVIALWGLALSNGRAEKQARLQLVAEHPGSLVERVRLWMLPQGRVDRDIPVHFIVADAERISFETIDKTSLLQIDVPEVGFVGLVRAQGDTAKDKAVTLIYGDDKLVVQFFTLTYAGQAALVERVAKAIGRPRND